jgi:hypothetical protein
VNIAIALCSKLLHSAISIHIDIAIRVDELIDIAIRVDELGIIPVRSIPSSSTLIAMSI